MHNYKLKRIKMQAYIMWIKKLNCVKMNKESMFVGFKNSKYKERT